MNTVASPKVDFSINVIWLFTIEPRSGMAVPYFL